MRIPAPNFTATPNDLFDEWLPLLSHVELKVLMTIMRKTFGWHKIRDQISLTQLEKITGSKRTAIIKATKNLQKMGLILKEVVGEKGFQKTNYELVVIDDSNNFTQYTQDTPPSILRIPTKETLTKETKEKKERDASVSTPPLFVFKRVKMEQEAYEKLVADFGLPRILEMLERLDEYADINPKNFKQYANHATVIRKWIREDTQKGASGRKMVMESRVNWAKAIAKKIGERARFEVFSDVVVFKGSGPAPDLVIKISDNGFEEQVVNRLRKMGLESQMFDLAGKH